MLFIQSLLETKKKEPEKKRIVFVETNTREPFPENTMSAVKKEINKQAKDLEKEWRSPIELVDFALSELGVPKPLAYLTERWAQYLELIGIAVNDLKNSRGMSAKWTRGI